MRGRARSTLLVLVLLLVLAGCGMEEYPPTPTAAPRPSATAVPRHSVKDGHLTFTVLELRCGLAAVFGSHAEGQPEGEFCRSRLRITNDDPGTHTYVARRQLLAYVGGEARPDPFAMAVRRQVDQFEVGARNLVELEVWWDVPRGARVLGVKVSGDRDPVGFQNASPVAHVPGGALIAVTPSA